MDECESCRHDYCLQIDVFVAIGPCETKDALCMTPFSLYYSPNFLLHVYTSSSVQKSSLDVANR